MDYDQRSVALTLYNCRGYENIMIVNKPFKNTSVHTLCYLLIYVHHQYLLIRTFNKLLGLYSITKSKIKALLYEF